MTATFAVAQVVLPVVVDQRLDGLAFYFSVVKAIAVVTVMSFAAAFLMFVAVPFVQTTDFAIRGLDVPAMMMLATDPLR